jgi:hypothetical protein
MTRFLKEVRPDFEAGKTFPWTSPKGPFGTECGSFFREYLPQSKYS